MVCQNITAFHPLSTRKSDSYCYNDAPQHLAVAASPLAGPRLTALPWPIRKTDFVDRFSPDRSDPRFERQETR